MAPESINSSTPSSLELEFQESPNGKKFEQAMKEVHLVETSNGKREWELWADEALAFKSEQHWTIENVKAIFFGEDGVFFTVTGNEGFVEPETKNMRVKGNVITRSSNGYVFKTEEASYVSVNRTLKSPGAIKMVGPSDKEGNALKLDGVGLDANLNESTINVLSDVYGRKKFAKGQTAKISSETAVFSGKNNKAHFSGNVVIDFDSMRLTGPDAVFEYDRKNESVKSLYVKNGVRVNDAVKYATSDNVRVFFEEEKLVFRGSPRVVQNNDELRGEEIVFLERGDIVKVQRARARVEEYEESQKRSQ